MNGRKVCSADENQVLTLVTIKAAKDVSDGDRRKTVRGIAESTGISKSSVQRISKSDLKILRECKML